MPEDPQKAPLDCVCVADGPLPESYCQEDYPGNLVIVTMQSDLESLALLLNHINFVLAGDFRFYRGLERVNDAQGCDLAQGSHWDHRDTARLSRPSSCAIPQPAGCSPRSYTRRSPAGARLAEYDHRNKKQQGCQKF